MIGNNNKSSLIIKIGVFAVFAALVVLFLILRISYNDKDPITSTEFYIYGRTDGIGIECGKNFDPVYVSFPNYIAVSDIYSVSTDPDVAYLSIDKDNVLGNRILACEVVTLKPGIAELYIRTSNGDLVSERYIVNVYESGESSVSPVITDVEDELEKGNVFVTPTGNKYHLKRTCAGNTAYQITLEEAVNKGCLPCKSCAIAK